MRLLPLILLANSALAADCQNPVKIAVIDSGFAFKGRGSSVKLCDEGHADFTKERIFSGTIIKKDLVPLDINGHGTNVVGLIDKYASEGGSNYCIVILKFYSELDTVSATMRASVDSLISAMDQKMDVINYSAGGGANTNLERVLISSYLDNHHTLVAAAGNNGQNLDLPGNKFYPASYDRRSVIVGSLNDDGSTSPTSNFGSWVNRWEKGMNQEALGLNFSGTSQATAVATGKIVADMIRGCNNGKRSNAKR